MSGVREWVSMLALAVVVTGCADTHSIKPVVAAQQKLSPAASAYVSVPADGRYGSTVYKGSGQMTASVIAGALMRRMSNVVQASDHESSEQSLAAAKKSGATYLISPDILHWEDRATEWSGKPDVAEVKVRIIDTASERVIASGLISGRSGWATLGGDHPQDLLPKPTEEYVESLF